jgi:peptidylprolyl isomerase
MLKKTQLVTLTSLGLFFGYGALQAADAVTTTSGNFADNRTATATTSSSNPSTTANPADQNKPSEKPIDMKKLSEAFGNFIGRNLQSPGLSFDLESIVKGIREGSTGKPSPLTEKEYEEMMTAVQEKAFKEMSTTNLKAANDFIEKNKKENGIIEVVPGKLQYKILNEGTGAVVEPHASPKIHYTGKYLDGTVFGTSEEMGGPITIPLDQTIPGFSKGIIGMKEGEKRRLFVHPDLGYGTTGQLPPNELLIFDIEAVKANSDDAKTKGGPANLGTDDDDDDDDFFLDDDEDDEEEKAQAGQMNKGQTGTANAPASSTSAATAGTKTTTTPGMQAQPQKR